MPDLVIERLTHQRANFRLRDDGPENLVGQDTGRRTLSHSTLNLWLACPQKFGWAKVDKLEPLAPRQALSLGRAFHTGVEAGDPQAAIDALLEAAEQPQDQGEQDRIEADGAVVYAATALYLRKWPEPVEEAREFEFLIRIRNPWTGHHSRLYDFHGFADGVLEFPEHLELIERKLVGQINEVSRKKLYLDRQISLVCYGLWRATGKPVKVVRYRYVRKPSIRRKKDERQAEYIERIGQEYADREDFYAPEFDPAYRDYRDLLRAEAELWVWAHDVRARQRDGFFPRNTSHCSDFGGCEFLPLCMGDPAAPSLYRESAGATTIEEGVQQ
jgi:hypothetical protein